jgi:hypothetical protein
MPKSRKQEIVSDTRSWGVSDTGRWGCQELLLQESQSRETRSREMRNHEMSKTPYWRFRYHELEMSRTLTTGIPKLRSVKSQKVDLTPFWSFEDRDLEVKNIHIKNVENAICEIVIYEIAKRSGLTDPVGECGRPHQKGQVEANDMWHD